MKIFFLVLLVILAAVIFALALTLLIRGIIVNSDAYSIAKDAIENNADVLERAGRIDSYGFMPIGNFSIRNGYGYASWRIRVNGFSRTVFIQIQLTKESGGEWIVKDLSIIKDR